MIRLERLIYVMGRGHSGSTILEALIANGRDIAGTGELVVAMDREGQRCSCGELAAECDFWRRVRDRFEEECDLEWEEAARLLKGQARVTEFVRTLNLGDDERDQKLQHANRLLLDAIADIAEVGTLVESSKEVTRALLHARSVDDVRLIHLVRDPVAILGSHLHRIRSGDGFPFLRRRFEARIFEPVFMTVAAVSWTVGNLLAESLRWLTAAPVRRVSYDVLCRNPGSTLRSLEDFVGTDLTVPVEAVEHRRYLEFGHQISGNRIRMQDEFVFRPEKAGGRPLPWYYRILVVLVTWPLWLVYRGDDAGDEDRIGRREP